ncbi:MAG: hypothetical protein HUU35_09200 [Armatimonadetes bacterium]|nr:hypothetical protein [Armatimonadota bacterium]
MAPGHEPAALALLAEVAATSGPFFTMHISPYDPLWASLRAQQPTDVTPPAGPIMMRAANLEVLRPVLAEIVEDEGGVLETGMSGPRVVVEGATLSCSWSRLLALAYDGRDLGPWTAEGLLCIEPDTDDAQAALAEVLPPRLAGRRPTDAF